MVKKRTRRGRPDHKPTKRSRDKVMWRIASNASEKEIALEFGISVPTLCKHYMVELETGWAKKKGEALDLLVKSARAGNVSAQGKLEKLIAQSNPEWTPSRDAPKDTGEGPKVKPALGKKAAAAEEAETAGHGTPWGTDLTPGAKPN